MSFQYYGFGKDKGEYAMKVFYVVTGTIPYGANIALINLIDEMRLRDIEVVVAYSSYGALTDWLNVRNIKSYEMSGALSLNYPFFSFLSSPFKWIYALWRQLFNGNYLPYKRLCKILRKEQPDIVHTNIGTCAYAYFAAKRCGIPHVWHLREYQTLDFNFNFFPSRSYFLRLLDKSYSIAITEDLFHFHKRNATNSQVIFDGVMHKNDIAYIEDKANYFLFVGRIDESKGAKNIVEAFTEACKDNDTVELWLAGEGDDNYMQILREIAKTRGLTNRVKFLGFRSDRYELMQKAKALIVGSKSEGFGFITVEAMMNGCLVIGKNTGGTQMIMEKAKDCEIPYMTKNELVDSIKEVMTKSPSCYKERILKAQDVARQLFAIEANGESVYQYYNNILENSNLLT